MKVAAAALWLALAAAAAAYLQRQGVPPSRWPEALRAWIAARGVWGPAVYILIFVVRPLVLLPPTVLTAASGLIWGPLGGTLFTLAGENVSAAVAFWGARLVGGGWAEAVGHPLLARLHRRLCGDAFRAVLVLRLLFAPFDLVNFACGLTTMSYRAFAAATFLGILPGAACFVLLGSSWRDPRLLAVSVAALALGLGGARVLAAAPRSSRRLEPDDSARDGATYKDLGADHFSRLDRSKVAANFVRRLKDLGYGILSV